MCTPIRDRPGYNSFPKGNPALSQGAEAVRGHGASVIMHVSRETKVFTHRESHELMQLLCIPYFFMQKSRARNIRKLL